MANGEKKLQSFNSFNAGEYSPSLAGRVDLESFGSSVRFSSNFISETTGGIKKFYGTHHIKDLSEVGQILLVPFYNSYEPMCLVFTSNFVGIILEDDYVDLTLRPLPTTDLNLVRWKQINDQILFVADDMPMQTVNFLGPAEEGGYKFEIDMYSLDYEPFFPIGWSGNYNGAIETVGGSGVITIKIPEDETSIAIELPAVLKGASKCNILGLNNYIFYGANEVVLGQSTGKVYRKTASGEEIELVSGIVSGSPTSELGNVVSHANIIDG